MGNLPETAATIDSFRCVMTFFCFSKHRFFYRIGSLHPNASSQTEWRVAEATSVAEVIHVCNTCMLGICWHMTKMQELFAV